MPAHGGDSEVTELRNGSQPNGWHGEHITQGAVRDGRGVLSGSHSDRLPAAGHWTRIDCPQRRLLAAQHYMRLAGALADAFTVYVSDRRGRGVSGPPGDRYGMDRECEDVAALLAESGAEFLFGHSSGGLIAPQAGRTLPQVTRLAVCEPPLSEHGSISLAWIGEFDRQVARGKPTTSYPRGGRVRCWSPCLRCTCVGRSAGSSSLMSRSRASSRSSWVSG